MPPLLTSSLVLTNCPCICSQAGEVPPALLSLILPTGQWLAFSWTSITRDHEILCAAWAFRASQRQGCSWTALVVSTMFQPTTSTFFRKTDSAAFQRAEEASMVTESCSVSQTPSLQHAAPTHCPGLLQGTGCPHTAPDPLSAAPSLPERSMLPNMNWSQQKSHPMHF